MFQGRSFLKEIDFSKDELLYLIDFAIHLKKLKKEHIQHKYLLDKTTGGYFQGMLSEYVIVNENGLVA
ncbi:MAG: hypothetical protein E6502_10820, partial [Lactococcus lactis]|nr:hypothetical protein [Lactococcus lactis]